MDRETSNKISILSFIAAFMVVMMHSVCTMDCSGWCARIYLSYGYDGLWNFSVPYFFVVVGYFSMNGYSEGKWSYSRAIYKRLWSLVVPYFVWNVIWLLVVTLPHCGWRVEGVDYLEAFGISAITPCNSPLWFVKMLFILVCCSPIVVGIVGRLHGKVGMLAIIAVALVLGMPLPGIKTIYRAFFYFSVGVWISIGSIQMKCNNWMLKVGWLIWFVLCGIQSVVRFERFFLCIPLLAVPLVWFSYDLLVARSVLVRKACADERIVAICRTSFFVYCVHGIIVSYTWGFKNVSVTGTMVIGITVFCCSVVIGMVLRQFGKPVYGFLCGGRIR